MRDQVSAENAFCMWREVTGSSFDNLSKWLFIYRTEIGGFKYHVIFKVHTLKQRPVRCSVYCNFSNGTFYWDMGWVLKSTENEIQLKQNLETWYVPKSFWYNVTPLHDCEWINNEGAFIENINKIFFEKICFPSAFGSSPNSRSEKN